jgi:hypothetical protein
MGKGAYHLGKGSQRMKVERGPATLERFRTIVFETVFKESK